MRRAEQYLRIGLKLLILSTIGVFLIMSRYLVQTPQPLDSVLPGESRLYKWRHGHTFYKVLGAVDAPALVLLHAPEVGASSYEMRHITEGLAQHFRVYAPDLPGFGLSDRPQIDYTANTYIGWCRDFLANVVGQPAILLASGLSCNYSVAVAKSAPELCKAVILLSPRSLLSAQRPKLSGLASLTAIHSLVGLVIYAFLTARPMLRQVVAKQHALNAQDVPEEELNYIFAAAHQFGAQRAAIAFLAGKLDQPVSLATLAQPVQILWGTHFTQNGQKHLPGEASTQSTLIEDAGLRVHEERPRQVIESILQWLAVETPVEIKQPAPLVETLVETAQPEAVIETPGKVEQPEPVVEEPVEAKQPEVASAVVAEEQLAQSGNETTTPDQKVVGAVEAYCVKCRQKRAMQNANKIVTKNGRSAMEGVCSVCGTRLFRFIAN